jgi:hypothetical protein
MRRNSRLNLGLALAQAGLILAVPVIKNGDKWWATPGFVLAAVGVWLLVQFGTDQRPAARSSDSLDAELGTVLDPLQTILVVIASVLGITVPILLVADKRTYALICLLAFLVAMVLLGLSSLRSQRG